MDPRTVRAGCSALAGFLFVTFWLLCPTPAGPVYRTARPDSSGVLTSCLNLDRYVANHIQYTGVKGEGKGGGLCVSAYVNARYPPPLQVKNWPFGAVSHLKVGPFGAVSHLKVTTESAWTALLSWRFHSIVVRAKFVFCFLYRAVWQSGTRKHCHVSDVVIHNICGVDVSLFPEI